jgi:hypothetical protein
LKAIGLTDGVNTKPDNILTLQDLIKNGGVDEDDTVGINNDGSLKVTRYINHFHDPLKNWVSSGLTTDREKSFWHKLGIEAYKLIYDIASVPMWAQEPQSKMSYKLNKGYQENDFTWSAAREAYYNALCSTKDSDQWKQNYIKCFSTLGHLTGA